MGILQSKKKKQKKNRPFNKDIKNGTSKGAVTKEANHSEANALTGNLNNTSKTNPGQHPTQLISHQMEPSNGNDAVVTRMHQVPVVDAPQNREQNIHKAVSITLKALNQNQSNMKTRNVNMKEEMNGQAEKEKQEPGITPAMPPEVHAEGRWRPFTVNQSCPHKVCRQPITRGQVQKWSDEYQNYLCEPPGSPQQDF